jgi:hypothetical protein
VTEPESPITRRSLWFGLIGLLVAAVVVWLGLFASRGSQIRLEGKFLKVRVKQLDEKSTIAVVDFRVRNPADYPFVVREAKLFLTTAQGGSAEGYTVAEVDAQRLFDFYKDLGEKYNASLLMKTRIAPRQSADYMLCARFDLTEQDLAQRKDLRLTIEDVDGAVVELR